MFEVMQQILTGWEPYIVLSVFILIMIYGLLYAIGYAFQSEEMKRTAKMELLQELITVFILLILFDSLSATFNYLSSSIHGKMYCDVGKTYTFSSSNLLDAVKCKFMEKASVLSRLYESLRVSADPVFNQFYLSWGLLGIPIYYQGTTIFNPNPSPLYWKVENYRLLNAALTQLLIGINAYIFALEYIKVVLMSIFLPLGIILRTFPFTRNVGSLLISAAIGFYLVFPTLYFITDPGVSFLSRISVFSNFSSIQANVAVIYYFFLAQPIVLFSITLIFVKYLNSILGGENRELSLVLSKVI